MEELYATDWAEKWALYHPDKVAFRQYETGATLTFARLNQLGNRLAYHLGEEFQIEKGDRIAVLAENCLEYLVLLAAAQKSGFIIVPLNYRLAAAEIEYLLQDAKPKLVIVEDKFEHLVESASPVWPLARSFSIL